MLRVFYVHGSAAHAGAGVCFPGYPPGAPGRIPRESCPDKEKTTISCGRQFIQGGNKALILMKISLCQKIFFRLFWTAFKTETLIHKGRKRFRGCTDIFKMAKKSPKFYILCLSNCYFESILIATEENVQNHRNRDFPKGKGPRADFVRSKMQTIAQNPGKPN